MSSCNCGLNHNHKHPKITASKRQPENFGLADKPEPAGVMIRPDRVKELRLDEKGTVTIILTDDNGKEVEELNIDFENNEKAEKWILDNFGEYLD
jgi:hypothetical protein